MSEVFGHLNVAGERVELRQDNVLIYAHLGHYALYNHVFVVTGEGEGAYVWAHHPSYEDLAGLAEENECTMHLNIPQVSELDERTYIKHVMSDVEESESFPEGWESSGTTDC